MSSIYIALIADATASRALPPPRRARLQHALRRALPEFNRRWRTALAARFALTLGDEVQALLTTADPVWAITHEVRFRFPDVEWVVACGRGTIAARSRTSPAAWPGPSSRPAIRCSGQPCRRLCEPAVRGPAARVHARGVSVAGAGGRPAPRRDRADRRGRRRGRRARRRHVPRAA